MDITLFPHHEQELRSAANILVAERCSFQLDAVEVHCLDVDILRGPVLRADLQEAAVGKADGDAGEAGGTQLILVAAGA